MRFCEEVLTAVAGKPVEEDDGSVVGEPMRSSRVFIVQCGTVVIDCKSWHCKLDFSGEDGWFWGW